VSISVQSDATQILQEWMAGDAEAPARLMPLVYQDLRQRAAQYLRAERGDHTLQPTALVHESYMKLVDQMRADWKGRAHFCRVAAQLMRRILMEHARTRNREKRGGKWEKIYLDETRELAREEPPDLVALDDALNSFAASYPRESEVVELKFFGGMERDEIAEVLNVSSKTVSRDWSFAKAWLRRKLIEEKQHA
jgi:RNA polymerase sigma-70 factor (ECF subfamily)